MSFTFKVWNWNQTFLSILCSLASLALHIYLSFHFYALKYDFIFKDSVCNINETFNCNAAHLSIYSSFLGIPLSIWGLCIHILILSLLLLVYFRLTEQRDLFLRLSFHFASVLLAGSLIMAFISVFVIEVYCIFCWILYFISILQWELLRRANHFSRSKIKFYFFELMQFFWKQKGILWILILPLAAFLIHQSILRSKGLKDLDTHIKGAISDWKSSPFIPLKVLPSLEKNQKREEAEMVISEFADFLCTHCKNAFLKLASFIKAYPKVRIEFYNYPLDGTCNKKVGFKNGISCRLAESVHCANQWNKGWELHDEIFLNQDEIRKNHLSSIDDFLKEKAKKLDLKWEDLLRCMNLEETKKAIQLQIELANKADVQGTPSIFVNGRILSNGYWTPHLEAVRKILIQK